VSTKVSDSNIDHLAVQNSNIGAFPLPFHMHSSSFPSSTTTSTYSISAHASGFSQIPMMYLGCEVGKVQEFLYNALIPATAQRRRHPPPPAPPHPTTASTKTPPRHSISNISSRLFSLQRRHLAPKQTVPAALTAVDMIPSSASHLITVSMNAFCCYLTSNMSLQVLLTLTPPSRARPDCAHHLHRLRHYPHLSHHCSSTYRPQTRIGEHRQRRPLGTPPLTRASA
jgi:hypothetical protein